MFKLSVIIAIRLLRGVLNNFLYSRELFGLERIYCFVFYLTLEGDFVRVSYQKRRGKVVKDKIFAVTWF